jgi:hypothetical protein
MEYFEGAFGKGGMNTEGVSAPMQKELFYKNTERVFNFIVYLFSIENRKIYHNPIGK